MYTSFQVKNFRCFRDLKIDDLARVNLIAGKNNVGKTALLEAFFIHCGMFNPHLVLTIDTLRGLQPLNIKRWYSKEKPWDSIFSGFDTTKTVELIAHAQDNPECFVKIRTISQPDEFDEIKKFITENKKESNGISLSFETQVVLELENNDKNLSSQKYYLIPTEEGVINKPKMREPLFPALFNTIKRRSSIKEVSEIYGEIVKQKKENIILDFLKIIEPRLQRLVTVHESDESIIYCDIGLKRLIPLQLMGDGISNFLKYLLDFYIASGGVILIDEFENGLHHSILTNVWKTIGKFAREYNTQFIATTHSIECIHAAHEAFSESESYDFRLHRLEEIEGDIKVKTLKQNTLEAAIMMNFEIR